MLDALDRVHLLIIETKQEIIQAKQEILEAKQEVLALRGEMQSLRDILTQKTLLWQTVAQKMAKWEGGTPTNPGYASP